MPITVYQPIMFGDTSSDLGGHTRSPGQAISLHLPGISDTQSLIGDADSLLGQAIGGDDTLTAFAYAGSLVIGDARTIGDRAHGGNDSVFAQSMTNAVALGDALTMSGRAQGGNDSVNAQGGTAAAYGDAYSMTDHARGGDDTVTGGGFPLATTHLYGDAQTLSGYAVGGNDVLIAAVSANVPVATAMYGDGEQLLGHAIGGNDTLVSATNGNDQMWGDAAVVAPTAVRGADTFVFSISNGHDQIMDFQPGVDHIQLNGFGFGSFSDLAQHIQYTPQGASIVFDANDSILIIGVTQLSASDFTLT